MNSKLDEPLLPLDTERQERMRACPARGSCYNFVRTDRLLLCMIMDVHALAQQLAESARIGTAVLGVLHSQRRSLEGAVDRQAQAANELEQTSNIMQRMWQMVKRKRLLYYSIAALLFGAIVLVLWLKLAVWNSHDQK